MNCIRAQHGLVAYLHGDLTPVDNAALLNHLAECGECRSKLGFERLLRESLRALPVPTPRADYLDKVFVHLQQVTAKRSQARYGLAGVLAATITLAVILGPMLFNPNPMDSITRIEMAVDEVKTVRLKFNVPHDFAKVTLSLRLPANFELEGYPGQREIRWETRLTEGVNVLSLPVIARLPIDGVVIASIIGKNKTKQFKFYMRASRLQSSLIPDRRVI